MCYIFHGVNRANIATYRWRQYRYKRSWPPVFNCEPLITVHCLSVDDGHCIQETVGGVLRIHLYFR